MLNNTFEHDVGEVLVCRKYLKGKFGKCSVNLEYVVKFTKDESIVLKDLRGTHSFELNRDVINKHFIHSYCRTCHSFQGSSIDEKYDLRLEVFLRKPQVDLHGGHPSNGT